MVSLFLWLLFGFVCFQVGFKPGHTYTQGPLVCYRSWLSWKQYKWLHLGSFPPLPFYVPLPPRPNTQSLGFTIYSYRVALASPTHHWPNLKHMQGKRGRGVCGRRGGRTTPTGRPPSHPVCMWFNTRKTGSLLRLISGPLHSLVQIQFGFLLSDSFGLWHKSVSWSSWRKKTNKGKCLKS